MNRIFSILAFAASFALKSAVAQNADETTTEDLEIPAHTFQSLALRRVVSYSTFVPQAKPPTGGWPIVLLLHGLGRNHRTLAADATTRKLVLKQNFVIVFADGRLGWYLDSKADPQSQYQSMLRELLAHARRVLPVSSDPQLTGICGWSMGGYGAMHFAQIYPDEVAAVATTIALLDFPNPRIPPAQNFPVSPLFGTDEKAWATLNCLGKTEKLRGKALFFITGKAAFDVQMNRNFHAALDATNIAHTYREISGAHDFPTVQASLPAMFEFLSQQLYRHPVK